MAETVNSKCGFSEILLVEEKMDKVSSQLNRIESFMSKYEAQDKSKDEKIKKLQESVEACNNAW